MISYYHNKSLEQHSDYDSDYLDYYYHHWMIVINYMFCFHKYYSYYYYDCYYYDDSYHYCLCWLCLSSIIKKSYYDGFYGGLYHADGYYSSPPRMHDDDYLELIVLLCSLCLISFCDTIIYLVVATIIIMFMLFLCMWFVNVSSNLYAPLIVV